MNSEDELLEAEGEFMLAQYECEQFAESIKQRADSNWQQDLIILAALLGTACGGVFSIILCAWFYMRL